MASMPNWDTPGEWVRAGDLGGDPLGVEGVEMLGGEVVPSMQRAELFRRDDLAVPSCRVGSIWLDSS